MKAALVVGALAFVSFVVRLAFFLEMPAPLGTDGYYYVVQVERWVRTGHLHVPDASWVLYFFAALGRTVGDPILAVKIGAAALAALCVPAAWFAGRRLAGEKKGAFGSAAAWIVPLWVLLSPTLTHLAGDFPKNLGCLAPLLCCYGWAAGPALGAGGVFGAAALLAAALAHRVGAGIIVLAAVGYGAGRLVSGVNGKMDVRTARVTAAAVCCALIFVVLSGVLPNLLHPQDLWRAGNQIQWRLAWPSPFPYFRLRATAWTERAELLLAWPALIWGLKLAYERPALRPVLCALLLPLLVCLGPFWRQDQLDIGYRLALMSPVLAVSLLTIGVAQSGFSREPSPGLLLCLLPLAAVARTGMNPQDRPPYERFQAVIGAIPAPLPELLIAHTGMNFLYDHLTGNEAMAWAPEAELPKDGVGRVVWGVRNGEWLMLTPRVSGRPSPVMLDPEYSYAREDVWEAFVARARQSGDDDLVSRIDDWRNPSKVRPASLLRNRRR